MKVACFLCGFHLHLMRYQKGKVIEPGNEVSQVKAGDVIYYDKSRGYTMLINNDKHTVIQLHDVVVVL